MKIQDIKYVGLYQGMVVSLYTLVLNGKKYEGTVIYNDKKFEINIDDSFTINNHFQLKYHPKYNEFALKLLSDLIPYHSHLEEGKLQIFEDKSW